jgi:hypothetical protein
MLVACRLASLSAFEAYYAGVRARAQCVADASKGPPGGERAFIVPLICPRPVPSLLRGLARGSVG